MATGTPLSKILYPPLYRVVSADERVQRYERVVAMALYGLSLTLQRLPDNLISEKREDWETFLTEKRLWKLVRHHNPYVRELPDMYMHIVTVHALLSCMNMFHVKFKVHVDT